MNIYYSLRFRSYCVPKSFPTLSGHLLSLPVFHLPFFLQTGLFQPTPQQFLLETFLHSNLQAHSLSALFTPSYVRKPAPSLVVPLLVPVVSSPYMHAGITHELSTVMCIYLPPPLRLSSKRYPLL